MNYPLYGSETPASLESMPMRSVLVEEVDPEALMQARDVGAAGLRLLCDLRPDPETMHRIDGFVASNAIPTGGRTIDHLGAARGPGEVSQRDLERYFLRNVDVSKAHIPVRDRMPGESVDDYMTYLDREVLRRQGVDNPQFIPLPNATDVPGTRFSHLFPPDTDGVIMGRVAVGDIEGARDALDNQVSLIKKFGGKLPNFNAISSLDRTNPLFLSYAVERFAAAYGKDWREVVAHYQGPINQQIEFWRRGRSYLEGITHDNGAEHGRQILLPGRKHDIVFRHYSDIKPDLATLRGLRPESGAEDKRLVREILGDSPTEEAFSKLVTDIRAACEWQDFADWEFADYRNLGTIRTTDIAPVHLQANMIHNLRMAGRPKEAKELADILNRRFWVDIDDTHGQYADLLKDGTPTKALHAAQALPLLVGGIVPPDRKLKLANTWRDALLRRYGFLISIGVSGQQWSGDPSRTGDKAKDAFVERMHERMYGRSLLDESRGEDREWPMVCALLVEAFTTAAIEEKMEGRDPGPYLEIAEIARIGTVEGVEEGLDEFGYVGEKYSTVNPRMFVNGGEYGTTPKTAQRGFGMTIGAYRSLAGRGLEAEVRFPDEYSWRWNTLSRSADGLLIARTATNSCK
jgi:hypothetical protein